MPSVMVIEQGRGGPAGLPMALQAEGYEVVAMLPVSWLQAGAVDYAADIAIFVADHLDAALTACIADFYQSRPRPIALSVRAADPEEIEEVIRAGVSAVATGGVCAQRLRPILESAIVRFEEMRAWRAELKSRGGEAHKVMERAKGILMRRRDLTEALAEGVLHTMAANQAKSVAEVAGTIVDAEERLQKI